LGDDHVFPNIGHSTVISWPIRAASDTKSARAALALVAWLYLYTSVSRTVLFWAAFILTRPLGATMGDLLDKPVNHGGFALGRFQASAVVAAGIVVL
jgi:uncharacterized membrane-anchored protein